MPVDVADQALYLAVGLSKVLRPTGFYAHAAGPDALFVVFPFAIACVFRSDPHSSEWAREVGRGFAIPDDQMPFETMFTA